jgi:hypothetical protein
MPHGDFHYLDALDLGGPLHDLKASGLGQVNKKLNQSGQHVNLLHAQVLADGVKLVLVSGPQTDIN